MKNCTSFLYLFFALFFCSCHNSSTPAEKETDSVEKKKTAATTQSIASSADILSRKQVPVLCYHHIRDIQMLSKANKGYEVTVSQFKDQMKALADSGYKTITPDQLYNYLAFDSLLPDKPVMITYDDTDEEQFSIAKPEMDKYGFKGVYFIMTVSIGRPHYMTTAQIKQLSDEGHIIASHTWDHHRVDRYVAEHSIEEGGKKKTVNDWDQQLTSTKEKLEAITGKPVAYFAYPYGIWNKEAIPEIEKRGYKMAFQLSAARDSLQPLYTARRMIISPEWSTAGMVKVMKTTFR